MDATKKTMTSKMFRGDGDNLVDALIEACQKPTLAALGPIVERDLVPYFGSCEPAETVCSSATPPRRASLSKDGQKHATGALLGSNVTPNNKRKGSPPNLRREPATSNDKKNVRSNNKATRPSSPVAPECSPMAVFTNAMAATTTPSGSPHYKCPGHFHSPKPEHLPMPTFSILARAHMHAASRTTCVAA